MTRLYDAKEKTVNDVKIHYWVDREGNEIEINPIEVKGLKFDINDVAVIDYINTYIKQDCLMETEREIESAHRYIEAMNPIQDLYNSLQFAYKRFDKDGKEFSLNGKSESREIAKTVYNQIINPVIVERMGFDAMLQNVTFIKKFNDIYAEMSVTNSKLKAKNRVDVKDLKLECLLETVKTYKIKSLKNLGKIFPNYLKSTEYCNPTESNGRKGKAEETSETLELKLDLATLSTQLNLYFTQFNELHKIEGIKAELDAIDSQVLMIHDLIEPNDIDTLPLVNTVNDNLPTDEDFKAMDAELAEIDNTFQVQA